MSSTGLKVPTSSPVLVTGATGYVAGVLIKQLLDFGVTVHAAVRDPSKTDRLKHLTLAAEESPGKIKFFQADLLNEGSYEEGMNGCAVVFHTASPFIIDVKDPQKELVEPAVDGTRNVLNSATKTPSVKRVIVTSSCAAIYTDAADTFKAPNETLTEDVYNMTASLEYQPYSFSKIMAELAAWQIAGSQRQWTMATINPSLVMGPGLKTHSGESWSIIKTLGDGTASTGVPRMSMGVVDVREVAQAHIVAAFDENVTGRHILNGTNTNLKDMAEALQEKYSDFPLPARAVPKTLFWLLGPYAAGISRRFISSNVDIPINLDNSKSIKELGIKYRPLSDTMCDMFQQLLDAGELKK